MFLALPFNAVCGTPRAAHQKAVAVFPGGEVAAPFGFVEVDQLVVGRLGPAAWRGDIFLRELRDRGREGNVGGGIEVLTSYGLLPVQLDMSLYLWIESGRQLPSPLTRGTSSRSRIGWAYRAGHIPGLLLTRTLAWP